MDLNNPILSELKEISPVLAALDRSAVYPVPDGYFDGLAAQVLLRIALDEKSGADPRPAFTQTSPYQVSAAYFDALPDKILQRIKAQESAAIDEIGSLSPLLQQLKDKNPFSIPEGYFNDFSENMVSGVKAVAFVNEELENLSPLMMEVKKENVYEVPEGYFNTLPAVILNKAKQQQPAKLVSMGSRPKLVRYAVAAAVAALLATGAWLYQKPTGKSSEAVALLEDKIKHASDEEIQKYDENTTVDITDIDTSADVNAAGNEIDSKDLLANISDEELQKYVDQHGEAPVTN